VTHLDAAGESCAYSCARSAHRSPLKTPASALPRLMPPIELEPRAIVHAADQPEQIQLRPPQKNHLAAQVLSRPGGNKLSFRRIRLTAAFGKQTDLPSSSSTQTAPSRNSVSGANRSSSWWRHRTNARHSFPAPARGACGSHRAPCLVTTARPSGCPPSVDLTVPRPWPRGSAGGRQGRMQPP
jgi:hypothetical protein